MRPEDIRLLENLTAEVWPAREYGRYCGWAMGFDVGVTGRANSVLPNAWTGDEGTLPDAIREVEKRYRARGLPALFKVSDASLPQGLDDRLAAAGYAVKSETAVMEGWLNDLAAQCPVDHEVQALGGPTDEWCTVTGWDTKGSDVNAARIRISRRISAPCAFFQARVNADPAGTAIGVARGEWAYLSGLHVSTDMRGRGIGSSIMGFFAKWAAENGATRVFLQVEDDNPRARVFYDRLGLIHAYDYHYRTQSLP